jgi:hypothetical protein
MGLVARVARIFPRREIGVFGMSRAGRKRKSGHRKPSGQLKQPKQIETDAVRTSRQPHRRALAHQLRAQGTDKDQVEKLTGGWEAESPIGRMWAGGLLKRAGDSDSQAARDRYDAGNMFAQIVGAYRSVIEAPRDVAGSGRGFPCQELLCALARENCECEHRKARYDRAFEALSRLSRRSLKAVNDVAVHRQGIAKEELVYLVGGLEELRRVFGLTARRQRPHDRNAK